jgi:5-methylcytosine-specific restriction protein A
LEGFSILRPSIAKVNQEMKFHMPYKPQHPCAHPGCAALTASRFCPAHTKQEARHYERYQRDPATRKRYGRSWAKVRAATA